MTQVLDTIITDDLKKAQGALNDGYMMPIGPYVDGGITIYVLHKMKEKRPEDPMFLVDNEVPYQMAQSKKEWDEVYDGEHIGLWKTTKNRKGEFEYVIYSHKHTQYFTPSEFSELMEACKQATEKLFQPNGDCYK